MEQAQKIASAEDLLALIDAVGILPFFDCGIAGYALEWMTDPAHWFTGLEGPWEWKGAYLEDGRIAYAKLFRGRAVFARPDFYAHILNFRRGGRDFDEAYQMGLVPREDKLLVDLLRRRGPLHTRDFKREAPVRNFDAAIGRLQKACFVTIRAFEYARDRHGQTYGWGLARYDLPERVFGADFVRGACANDPEDSRARVLAQIRAVSGASAEDAARLIR